MDTEPEHARTPLWLVEGLDVAEQRRLVIIGVAVALSILGVVLAIVAPGLVPPTPLVGGAVGLAALLLGYAAAVAIDAADLTVRGPRHVRAAGGELVAIVPSEATTEDARPLARAVLDAREDEQRILLGLAATGRDTRAVRDWSEAVGRALAGEGVSVLTVDLASGRSEQPGLYEVLTEDRKIGTLADLDQELMLAHLGAGRDLGGAITGLVGLPERLPRDLDVLLVALPSAASREVVRATTALDHVLLVAQRDGTARVDLIAALDALEATGTPAQAILVDDRTVSRLMAGSTTNTAAAGSWTATSPAAPVSQDAAGPPDAAASQDPGSSSQDLAAAADAAGPQDPAASEAATAGASALPDDGEGAPAGEAGVTEGDAVAAPEVSAVEERPYGSAAPDRTATDEPGANDPDQDESYPVQSDPDEFQPDRHGPDGSAALEPGPHDGGADTVGPGDARTGASETSRSSSEEGKAQGERGVRIVPPPEEPTPAVPWPPAEHPAARWTAEGSDEPSRGSEADSPDLVEARDAEVLRAAKAAQAQVVIDSLAGAAAEESSAADADAAEGSRAGHDESPEVYRPQPLTWAAPSLEGPRRPDSVPSLGREYADQGQDATLAEDEPQSHQGGQGQDATQAEDEPQGYHAALGQDAVLDQGAAGRQMPDAAAAGDDTDEVPRRRVDWAVHSPARAVDPEPTRVAPEEADSDEDDPLHTTAQLAILVDELQERDERS